MSTFTAGQRFRAYFQIPQADLLAPVALDQTSPDDGALVTLQVIVQVAITTGGTVKLQNKGVDVPGSTITIPNGATKGTVFTASIPQGTDASMIAKGDRVSVVPAGFATAGAINGHFTVGTQSKPAGV